MDVSTVLAVAGIVIGFFAPTQLFFMSQIAELKKTIANLCERMRSEETKTEIYHGPPHDLQDK